MFDGKGINFRKDLPENDDTSDCPHYDACLQYAENIVNKFRDVSFLGIGMLKLELIFRNFRPAAKHL